MLYFKLFKAFLIVYFWSKKALKDGNVSYNEALELGTKLATLLRIPTGYKQFKNIALSGDKIWGSDKEKEGT